MMMDDDDDDHDDDDDDDDAAAADDYEDDDYEDADAGECFLNVFKVFLHLCLDLILRCGSPSAQVEGTRPARRTRRS